MSNGCKPPVLASDRRVAQLGVRLAPMPLVGPILHGRLVNLHYSDYGSSCLLMWLLLSKVSAVKKADSDGEGGADDCCTAIRNSKQMLGTLLPANNLPKTVVLPPMDR